MIKAFWGLMIPFFGTSLGAAGVLFQRRTLRPGVEQGLLGFAAGVMLAASVWSLLLPALEQGSGRLSFLPAAGGFWVGVLFLRGLDRLALRITGMRGSATAKLVLAVTIHNLPEGMAVGAVYSGLLLGRPGVTALGAMSLALGIAVQNLPEGAVISMPLRAGGMSRGRALFLGVLSGAVEPVGGFLTMLLFSLAEPAMPWLLSFAAGAMVSVTVEELLPGVKEQRSAIYLFTLGFTLMMTLDVALGS